MTLSYSHHSAVRGGVSLIITATFSEVMASSPTIAIAVDSTGDGGTGDLSATAMTDFGNGNVWTFARTIPSGEGNTGTALVTISGKDRAGNPNTPASNNTFEIDNTGATVALTYNRNRPVMEGESLVITATFSEGVSGGPRITIDATGAGDIISSPMAYKTLMLWTYTYSVPSGNDGTAIVTISATTDGAGNPSAAATNNTFTIDNTP